MFLWPQEGDPAKPLRDPLPKSTFPAVPPGHLSQEVLTSLITQVSKWVFEEFEESICHFDHDKGSVWGPHLEKIIVRIKGKTVDFPTMYGGYEPVTMQEVENRKAKIVDTSPQEPLGDFLLFLIDLVKQRLTDIPAAAKRQYFAGNVRTAPVFHVSVLRGTCLVMPHTDEPGRDGPGCFIINMSDHDILVLFTVAAAKINNPSTPVGSMWQRDICMVSVVNSA